MIEPDGDLLTTSFEYHGDVVSYGPSHSVRPEPKPGIPLLVLGVHGKLGWALVEQALQREHTITTLSKRPLTQSHPRLRVVKGDVLDLDTLDTAMRGQQAVLVALGDVGDVTAPARLAEAYANVAHAMRRYSVHRISWFVPEDQRAQSRQYQELLLSPPPRPGRERPSRTIAPLEWVMVQAHAVTDAPAGRLYEVATGPSSLTRPIPRANVASFMLDQLDQPRYAGSTVLLSEVELPPERP